MIRAEGTSVQYSFNQILRFFNIRELSENYVLSRNATPVEHLDRVLDVVVVAVHRCYNRVVEVKNAVAETGDAGDVDSIDMVTYEAEVTYAYLCPVGGLLAVSNGEGAIGCVFSSAEVLDGIPK